MLLGATYEIAVGASDLDLLHVMHIKRQEIEKLSVQQHSQKVQFSSKIELKKPPKLDNEFSSSQPDRISLYVISKMERVDFGGLTDKSFHAMVEQMLLALNNFASHGSGWTLDQIDNIEVRLVKKQTNKRIFISSASRKTLSYVSFAQYTKQRG